MNHVSALKHRFLPAWLPYQCESCWNFSWGPKFSHFFHIFTHWYVTLHLWVCTFSLEGMSPFTRGIPLFTRGYVTVHLRVCHLHLLMSIMFFFSHASLTNVTKKWSASNCDLKTPSRAARIWNPKFECNEAWNPSNGKSLRSWPQPWENSPARWVHQKVVAWWITRRVSFFNFSVLLECKTNLIIWSDRDSLG